VNGKEGFYLRSEFGNFLIEPQVEVGPSQGVAISSRVDFVFYPERPLEGELPIAVFTDGYEYHADPNGHLRTGIDTAQRMALVRSGRFRVWSLTWDDVQDQFKNQVPKFQTEFLTPGAKLKPLLKSLDPAGVDNWNGLAGLSSFGALMLLLGNGRHWNWTQYARAYAVSLLDKDPANPSRLVLKGDSNHSDGSPLLRAQGGMDVVALQARDFATLDLNLQLFDDYAHHDVRAWKKGWREFLRVGNMLQFLEGSAFVSSIGLAEDMYGPSTDAVAEPRVAAPGSRLTALLELFDPELHSLCHKLTQLKKVMPEAGFELADERGEIIATAELAWPACRIAVLLEHESGSAPVFEAAGWRPFQAVNILSNPQPLIDSLPEEVA
jgi:DEAD/DEAH box helicase domain-containing protein